MKFTFYNKYLLFVSFRVGKVTFLKEDKQPINTDHLTVVNNEVQKLAQRHSEIELEIETAKSKIFLSQKKTLDMIKEGKDVSK